MLQPFGSSTSTGGRRNTNPSFADPQVRAYTAKLKERIKNLADKGTKSVITSDALEYAVKPACRAALASNPALQQLFADGPVRNNIQYGHQLYSWFLHAAATECVSQWIMNNIDEIFGTSGPLRQKVNAGVAKVQSNGGNVVNYLKRTFSRPIKTYYVSVRLDSIQNMWKQVGQQLLGNQNIQNLLNLALQAKRAGAKSVAAFQRGDYPRQGGFGQTGMPGGFLRPMPVLTTLTPSAPSTSSSSSSSSSSVPQPFGLNQLTGSQ